MKDPIKITKVTSKNIQLLDFGDNANALDSFFTDQFEITVTRKPGDAKWKGRVVVGGDRQLITERFAEASIEFLSAPDLHEIIASCMGFGWNLGAKYWELTESDNIKVHAYNDAVLGMLGRLKEDVVASWKTYNSLTNHQTYAASIPRSGETKTQFTLRYVANLVSPPQVHGKPKDVNQKAISAAIQNAESDIEQAWKDHIETP